jgi:hypothetical protein
MANKNKQYRIEKGLLLFTQPRSPYFYGKIRLKGKYHTKSFSPISDFDTAKEKLYAWKNELLEDNENTTIIQNNDRKEYTDFTELNNNFQFLDVGRYDPVKKSVNERKIILEKFMVNIIHPKHRIKLIDV